jgi:hypothetical protein
MLERAQRGVAEFSQCGEQDDRQQHHIGAAGVLASLHQPLGCPALAKALAAADFRSGHPASCRCGRDRQTWPGLGDQATAGRTPHPTADECGHTTGQARSSTGRHTTTVSSFRLTATPATTTRRAGPPDNTHRQRPTPFGPHRTHSCSLIRNGCSKRNPLGLAGVRATRRHGADHRKKRNRRQVRPFTTFSPPHRWQAGGLRRRVGVHRVRRREGSPRQQARFLKDHRTAWVDPVDGFCRRARSAHR